MSRYRFIPRGRSYEVETINRFWNEGPRQDTAPTPRQQGQMADRLRQMGLYPTEPKPEVKAVRFKSCALWPSNCCPAIGNYSDDMHDTRDQAEAVCQMLCERGFGGDGEFFPLRTWVEEVAA